MRRKTLLLAILSLTLLTACNKNTASQPVGDPISPGFDTTASDPLVSSNDTIGGEWKESILSAPIIGEVEHEGNTYQICILNGVKYFYNTATGEIITGTTTGDATGTALRDWVVPHGSANLKDEDALFPSSWANTGARLRELIGYCDENYILVTRARTAEYVEYIYKDKADTHYRISATDGTILYSTLAFVYIFDIQGY